MIEIRWNPSPRQLRWFAAVWFPLFCLLAGWIVGRATEAWLAVGIAWAVAAALALVGWLVPPLIRPAYRGLVVVTAPIGWVVSYVLLGLVYFVVLAPIGVVLRLTGRDPLRLRGPGPARTLWKPVETATDPRHYLRQS
jgi:hypothetical protein